MVCDAIDPNMTFVIPLASAIVERRGGMLIHGAIIALEYGLPCVTGVPDADKLIDTEDQITVDGYLGVVTINRNSVQVRLLISLCYKLSSNHVFWSVKGRTNASEFSL